jgi:aldehyde dehydrogenase (NAD+)
MESSFNQGHVCCAGSRLFVQESVYNKVLRKLKDRIETLIVGDPLDKNTDSGPINSKSQLETINKYMELVRVKALKCSRAVVRFQRKGFFCRPTLFTNVSQSHRIAQEELFGPVLAIQTFRTDEEVIEKANNTPYGLSAGVWTDKGRRFLTDNKMRAGVVLGEYL